MDASELVRQATGARAARRETVLQTLWSGYGEIVRYRLEGARAASAILKHVVFPTRQDHPRGWNNDRSHQRKVSSYAVEMTWYRVWAAPDDPHCRMPRCLAIDTEGTQHRIVLEDLDAAGYPLRKTRLDRDQARLCLVWLARFHARFLGVVPEGLWPEGSYWHLATRPDEWAAIADPAIRASASALDAALRGARYRSIVHGDAKVANFCFAADGRAVAALDFQYAGGGCGMRDVAYFLGSALSEREQEDWEDELLDAYFDALRTALQQAGRGAEATPVEHEWRTLFPVAQADFYRFLVGWSPEHWKIHDFSRRRALAVVREIQSAASSVAASGPERTDSATSSQ
ncbi:phosphotransferase [Thioalkalivibrio sp. ALJT]|uniref:phosphotransferase n=1 Tax=Thioalkalivibrio sp. ALJT TaxID=1158146 RepID=UPI000363109A|nr:phosphotransferase [Thioalkalivibrio sp. ALJT]